MMKRIVFPILLLAVLAGCAGPQTGPTTSARMPKLGVQTWTLRDRTFFEAVEQVSALGLKFVEAYPGQRLGGGFEGTMNQKLDAATRGKILAKLKETGVTVVSFGVVTANSDAEWRQLFEFAQTMGIQTIVSEPEPAQLPMLDKLCANYRINLALHNHPKPSRYWNPETILAAVKGCSRRVGACTDTGHWVRSGLDPIACLKQLRGRIIELHLKDLDRRAAAAHDVPWGTGDSNMPGMLAELKQQGFKGYYMIEYEQPGPQLINNLKRCIEYFNNCQPLTPAQLLAGQALVPGMTRDVNQTWAGVKVTPNNQWPRPVPLFADDLGNATCPANSWAFADGVLTAKGGGDIWTKDRYGDFVLELDFKCETNTNSGVFLRCTDTKKWLHTGLEIQILQDDTTTGKHSTGALYDCQGPTKQVIKPVGEWNHYKITAKANKIVVELNGKQVNDVNLDQWTEAHKNPDGTPNKFNTAYKDMSRDGFIGLQYHGSPVWFRNLTVMPLPGK